MDKLLHTVKEVTILTRLSKWKVYDLLREGALRSTKIGTCRRIPAESLREFVASLSPDAAR